MRELHSHHHRIGVRTQVWLFQHVSKGEEPYSQWMFVIVKPRPLFEITPIPHFQIRALLKEHASENTCPENADLKIANIIFRMQKTTSRSFFAILGCAASALLAALRVVLQLVVAPPPTGPAQLLLSETNRSNKLVRIGMLADPMWLPTSAEPSLATSERNKAGSEKFQGYHSSADRLAV